MKIADHHILDFIRRKLGIRTCEACGMTDWRPDPTLYELREHDATGTGDEYAGVRLLVALSCGRCGNTKLFDAVTAGLVDRAGDPLP